MELKSNPEIIFSRQEHKIIKLAAQDYSNEEIGFTLFISINTVKRHKQNIMQKLGIKGKRALNKFLRKFIC